METLSAEFYQPYRENLATEHLCCIIRSRKPHPGVEAKRLWLADRLEGRSRFPKTERESHGLLSMRRWKRPGYLFWGRTTFIFTAFGFPANTRAKGMGAP